MQFAELNPPSRLLLGPGPSNVSPRVYRAMMTPVIGYLDPDFLHILDEVQALLRAVFGTANDLTLPVSGTGSAGMEAALANLLEPGDTIVVGVNGFFGLRMVEMARRLGAQVVTVEAPWGRVIEPEQVEKALGENAPVKVVAVVHAETSTGVLQPLEEMAHLAQAHDALLLVDAVTSLGGCELRVDDWGIDVCYAATQKCLSAPPGLAPITFGPRAVAAIERRRTPVVSWYLDVTLLRNYWGAPRVYHHTPSMTLLYALREALREVLEEGLAERIERHRRNGQALWAGLEAMGLAVHAQEGHRLPVLTAVRIPEGVDDRRVRGALLSQHGIEIGGGLGELAGRVWRIGLMGYSCQAANVLAVLAALEGLLWREGFAVEPGAGVAAATRVLQG